MCLSDCSKCKYLNRHSHHSEDIICSLNPAYANAWKRLNTLDEYTLKYLPIDDCRDFELDPAFEKKEISLSLSFFSWQTLARKSKNPDIIEALKDVSFEINLSLTVQEWQAIADSNTDPFVRVALENQGIVPHRDPWIVVDSSCIDAVAYPHAVEHSQQKSILIAHSLAPDGDAGSLLKIRFNSGQVYQYDNVPHEIFLRLLDADSKGRYFNHYIKDVYSFRLL